MPFFSEFFARRQIPAFAGAREVEIHGDNGQFARVVEGFAVNAHPFAQAVATAVIPDDAAFFRDAPGRLPHDHDFALGPGVEQRLHPALGVVGIGWVCRNGFGDCLELRVGNLGGHISSLDPF